MSNLPTPAITMIDGQPRVSSLDVAEKFGKAHKVVLQAIQRISADLPDDFNGHNFVPVEYTDAKGEKRPMYQLSRDGFSLLAMGFTGKKALAWKVRYIEAFNAMEAELLSAQPAPSDEIPASCQAELHALVDAKLSAFPRAIHGKARSEIWARFNRHFKIARYAQLPAERMPEARDYLIEMEVKALAAMPAMPESTPTQDNVPVPASPAALIDAKTYECGKRFFDDVNELRRKAEHIREVLHLFGRPGGRSAVLSDEKRRLYDNANDAANMAVTSLNQTIYALRMIYNVKAHVSFCR